MKKDTVGRAELIDAAADLWLGAEEGETLPTPDQDEYMRGLCELIANAAGAEDPYNGKEEVWEEIAAAIPNVERRYQARAYAIRKFGKESAFLDAIADAYLAGLNEKGVTL